MKILSKNRRIHFDYIIEDTLVAGMMLEGWEVKAILSGKLSINESYARIINNDLFIVGSHCTPGQVSQFDNPVPDRNRKLLLTKSQLSKWYDKVKLSGYTIVVADVHYADSKKIKATVCLCKGKALHDKRDSIRERDIQRKDMRDDS